VVEQKKKKSYLRIKRYIITFTVTHARGYILKKNNKSVESFAQKRERESDCLAERRKEETRLERREIDIIQVAPDRLYLF